MLLYASFVNLIENEFWAWIILGYMWGIVFVIRMLIKDKSLSKKKGWDSYSQTSWMLVPKLGGKSEIAIPIYAALFTLFTMVYLNGGIEATVKIFLK